MTYTDQPARYLLTIDQARSILLSYGIQVFCSYPGAYVLRRDLPWYGDAEKRRPIKEGFSVAHASLGDVRDMARAYQALDLPQDRASAEHCRQQLGDAWRTYTAARVHAESIGSPELDWGFRDDSPAMLQQLRAQGSERAHWHIHRVWQENTRERLSTIAGEVAQ